MQDLIQNWCHYLCVGVCVQIAKINLKRVNKRMNCFCLVATLQTLANQRLIFRSHEVSLRLQTSCAAVTAVPENNRRSPKFHSFLWARGRPCGFLRQTAQIMRVISVAASTIYPSPFFKCFAHLFPLNISSSLNIHLTSSLNFLPVSLRLLSLCLPFRLGNH